MRRLLGLVFVLALGALIVFAPIRRMRARGSLAAWRGVAEADRGPVVRDGETETIDVEPPS